MGDIPGLNYEPPFAVDRSRLPGHDATARVEEDSFLSEHFGREFKRLRWTIPGVEYPSGSPASSFRRERPQDKDVSCQQLLQECIETLELPGEPSDYHWALQNTAGTIANSPEALDASEWGDWAEWLWWQNIRLAQVCPDALTIDRAEGEARIPVLGVTELTGRYLREGWLQGAIEVAKVGVELGMREDYDELTERMEALQAEDEH